MDERPLAVVHTVSKGRSRGALPQGERRGMSWLGRGGARGACCRGDTCLTVLDSEGGWRRTSLAVGDTRDLEVNQTCEFWGVARVHPSWNIAFHSKRRHFQPKNTHMVTEKLQQVQIAEHERKLLPWQGCDVQEVSMGTLSHTEYSLVDISPWRDLTDESLVDNLHRMDLCTQGLDFLILGQSSFSNN